MTIPAHSLPTDQEPTPAVTPAFGPLPAIYLPRTWRRGDTAPARRRTIGTLIRRLTK